MNKLIKSILFMVISATVVFATESAPTDSAAKPVAPTEVTATESSSKLSDASADFLRFALAKAEKYSGKVEDAIGKGVDLAVQEAPETARQWITWRAWYHGLRFSIPFLLLFVCGISFAVSLKRSDFDNGNVWSFITVFSGVIGGFSLLAAIFNFDNLFSLIQIWVAPRIYMIEELIKLTK